MNNIHFDSPPIMADGRTYSNWQPGAVINENIRKQENIHTNRDYRHYLQANANSIMTLNKRVACEHSGCTPLYSKQNPAPPSDLKQVYLSRQQLQEDIFIHHNDLFK
jgi:hypothetical protein